MRALLNTKKRQIAEGVCRLVLKIDKRNSHVIRILIRALTRQSKFNEARAWLNRLETGSHGHPENRRLTIRTSILAGDYEQAGKQAAAFLNDNHKEFWVIMALAQCLMYQGDSRQAADTIDDNFALLGGNSQNILAFIQLVSLIDEQELCLGAYRHWEEADPENPRALIGYARYLAEAGSLDQAAAFLRKALAMTSTEPALLLTLNTFLGHARKTGLAEKKDFEDELSRRMTLLPESGHRARFLQRKKVAQARHRKLAKDGEPPADISVSYLCPIHRKTDIPNAVRQLTRQDWPRSQFIFSVNSHEIRDTDITAHWPSDTAPPSIVDSRSLRGVSAVLNNAVRQVSGDVVVRFDADNLYFPGYTQNMLNVLLATGADLVFKGSKFFYFEAGDLVAYEHKLQNLYALHNDPLILGGGATSCFWRRLFESVQFNENLRRDEDSQFLRRCLAGGHRLAVSDPFDFVSVRGPHISAHTSNIADVTISQIHYEPLGDETLLPEIALFPEGP